MWLSKAEVRAHLVADMTKRFSGRNGNFPNKLKISALGFPSAESLREWGKALNRAKWFTGWFTPSEFLGCVTIGPVPNSDDPNLIDLMFNTQTRPPERAASRTAMLRLFAGAADVARKKPAAAPGNAAKAKKAAKKVAKPKG